MPSVYVDLPDSPAGYATDVHRTVLGTNQVVRFRVEFSSNGPQVVAASKEEGVGYTNISIVDLPPFTSSSKQSEVLATLQQRAIACFHGKVHFLPDAYTYYKKWKAELAIPGLSLEQQKELEDRIHKIAPEAEAVRILLSTEKGSGSLKSLPLFGKLFTNVENELLLPTIALAYQALGVKYDSFLSYEASFVCYQHILSLAIQLDNSELKEAAYSNLGLAYQHLGEHRTSIECYEKALQITEQTESSEAQGRAYTNLGTAYHKLSNYKKAIECYEKALKIAEQIDDPQSKGKAYNNLGTAYQDLGEYWKAIEFHNKRIKLAQQTGSLKAEQISYNNLGITYNKLRDYNASIDCFNKTLNIAIQNQDLEAQAGAYANLGTAYDKLENYPQAIDFHFKALDIAEQTGHLDTMIGVYGNLGAVYGRCGENKTAVEYHKKRLEIVKKTGNLGAEQISYNDLGNTYRRLKEYPSAIEAYEESIKIAKQLLENNTEDNLQAGIAFFETVYHPFRSLEELLATDSIATHSKNPLGRALRLADSGRSQALVGVLAKEVGEVRKPLSNEQMHKIATQYQTTFLVYSCSSTDETKAWVWVIPSKGEITHRILDLTPMKEEMKTNDNRTEHLKGVGGSNRDHAFVEVADWVTRGSLVINEAKLAEKSKLMKVWYECLIEPIEDMLPQGNGARLTIVPDAVIGDLPFSLFKGKTGETLLERYTLSTVPSIQTLAYLDARDKNKASTRRLDQVCIVANPEGSMLEGAEEEGKAVANFFKSAKLLMDENATFANVKKALSEVGFIHLACHGQTVDLNNHPIKQNPNSVFQGSFQLAGSTLYAEDLISRPLNAKLAVLSACHSGKGSLLKEGVVGPMHALLAAGVSTVVGTRWAINDNATMLIIKTFYDFYFNETPESRNAKAEGRPFGAPEALREALLFVKKEVARGALKSPDPLDPEFTAAWGAFFLVGLPDK